MAEQTRGRPTVMTEAVIGKLEEAFAFGSTDLEACFYAGISKDALYDYQVKHPEFTERKEALKDNPAMLARKNVYDALSEGDKDISKWYLERKKKDEFSTKTESENKNVSIDLTEKVILKESSDE